MANITGNPHTRGKNIAFTSRLSHRRNLLDGRYETERAQVMVLLSDNVPRTSRQIAADLDKERTNITRSLYDLDKAKKVIVSKVAPCPITKRLVRFYKRSDGSEGLARLIKKVGLTCTHLITKNNTGKFIEATKKPLLLRWLGYLNESNSQLTDSKVLEDLVKQFEVHTFSEIETAIEYSKSTFAANGNKRITFVLNHHSNG